MYEIKSMSYEECRAEHFKALMKKMERKINYWQGKKLHSLKPLSELSRANNECSEAGVQYSFYKDALEALAAAPKWISVEERLPEGGAMVICKTLYFYEVLQWHEKDDLWYSAHSVHVRNFVTHWMPLPSTEGLNDT